MFKISIITVVRNNKIMVENAIKAVLNQKYPAIEYIIVDGGSTDGTVDIIKSFGSRISKFVSEKDNGIYDAMNKGIAMSTGDVVAFLNADDLYVSDSTVQKVADAMIKAGADSCYGDIFYVDKNDTNKVVRHWKSRPFKKGLFKYGIYPPHPGFFVKKSVLDKYGYFNTKFRISADYELILRLLEKHGVSTCYLPEVLVKMRVGGESNKSIINIVKANLECYKAWRENGLPFNPVFVLLKPLNKFSQYFLKQ